MVRETPLRQQDASGCAEIWILVLHREHSPHQHLF